MSVIPVLIPVLFLTFFRALTIVSKFWEFFSGHSAAVFWEGWEGCLLGLLFFVVWLRVCFGLVLNVCSMVFFHSQKESFEDCMKNLHPDQFLLASKIKLSTQNYHFFPSK